MDICLLADGHLTPEPIENIYSGVVSLRNLRLVIFLGNLNHLEMIQFTPKMDENCWRYGGKLVTRNKPNWQRIVVLCVHNTTSALNISDMLE